MWLALLLLASTPDGGAAAPVCKTVAECWLADDGSAIARPKKLKGRKLPTPDCGKNLKWLRYELGCEANQCVARFRGDKC